MVLAHVGDSGLMVKRQPRVDHRPSAVVNLVRQQAISADLVPSVGGGAYAFPLQVTNIGQMENQGLFFPGFHDDHPDLVNPPASNSSP